MDELKRSPEFDREAEREAEDFRENHYDEYSKMQKQIEQQLKGIARTAELIEADGEGRVVIFPCEVGDTVYAIKDKRILVLKIESWHRWVSGHLKFSARTEPPDYFVGYELHMDSIGKDVFLTREAAEKALGMKKDESADVIK